MAFSVGLVQCDQAPGDLDANLEAVADRVGRARGLGADLVVFPEMMLSGTDMARAAGAAIPVDGRAMERLATLSRDVSLCVGFIERTADFRHFIAAAYLEGGALVHVQRKVHVVGHGLYDETRLCGSGAASGRSTHASTAWPWRSARTPGTTATCSAPRSTALMSCFRP